MSLWSSYSNIRSFRTLQVMSQLHATFFKIHITREWYGHEYFLSNQRRIVSRERFFVFFDARPRNDYDRFLSNGFCLH